MSWDQALDLFAQRLNDIKQKYGPESVGFFPHGVASGFFSTLMKAYGTPNSAEPAFAQCRGPREVGYALTFGQGLNSPEPVDLEEAKLIVLIGSHIGENVFTSQVTAFAEGLSRGAKLIVVDPRFSTAAAKADYWLPIRPGTDTALLLAWINVLMAEGIYDREYIEKYAHGFPELAAHVREFTPEWAEPITEISAKVIRADGSRHGRCQACRGASSRTSRDLVRQRHATGSRHGDPDGADRQLGTQGRDLSAHSNQDREVRAAAISQKLSVDGRTGLGPAIRWPPKSRDLPTG